MSDQKEKPYYGEPSGQEPDMGEGGDENPDAPGQARRADEATQAGREASSEAKDQTAPENWTPTQS